MNTPALSRRQCFGAFSSISAVATMLQTQIEAADKAAGAAR
jgi:hypothetical protein